MVKIKITKDDEKVIGTAALIGILTIVVNIIFARVTTFQVNYISFIESMLFFIILVFGFSYFKKVDFTELKDIFIFSGVSGILFALFSYFSVGGNITLMFVQGLGKFIITFIALMVSFQLFK